MRNLGTALVAALATLLLTPTPTYAKDQPPGKNAILLSNVQALTLRTNRQTTSRRVSAAPQLKCIGHEKICNLYEIETMRCKNEGYDYDEEDIQWTCTASLPSEFKLGSTDVICEGYRNSEDVWVLKGSCGVEYRMLLTDEGEERFGKDVYRGTRGNGGKGTDMVTIVFWVLFIGVFVFIVAAACCSDTPITREPRRRRWGWGGGGGGRGDDGYYPGPPPPYSSSDCSSGSQSQGWRPGFWSGLGAGGAAGYGMGRNSARRSNRDSSRFNDPGEGSSRRSSTPSFSTTTTGTGFGSTRRR